MKMPFISSGEVRKKAISFVGSLLMKYVIDLLDEINGLFNPKNLNIFWD